MSKLLHPTRHRVTWDVKMWYYYKRMQFQLPYREQIQGKLLWLKYVSNLHKLWFVDSSLILRRISTVIKTYTCTGNFCIDAICLIKSWALGFHKDSEAAIQLQKDVKVRSSHAWLNVINTFIASYCCHSAAKNLNWSHLHLASLDSLN